MVDHDALFHEVFDLFKLMRRCRWPKAALQPAAAKYIVGRTAHADDAPADAIDPAAEAMEECLDIAGYAAIAASRGLWSWRWTLSVALAGVAWRLLRREVRK